MSSGNHIADVVDYLKNNFVDVSAEKSVCMLSHKMALWAFDAINQSKKIRMPANARMVTSEDLLAFGDLEVLAELLDTAFEQADLFVTYEIMLNSKNENYPFVLCTKKVKGVITTIPFLKMGERWVAISGLYFNLNPVDLSVTPQIHKESQIQQDLNDRQCSLEQLPYYENLSFLMKMIRYVYASHKLYVGLGKGELVKADDGTFNFQAI